ncbi:MAG: DUF169 domain-containing protein [Bryobacteraceae bacterium]
MSSSFTSTLGLQNSPVSIAFLDAPPAGLEAWQSGAVPAGCTFWRAAMNGRAFYTVPSDHLNCAVGAHTHAIPQPENRAGVLNETVGFMVETGYLQMSEVAGIPTLAKTPNFIAYGPADSVPFQPDVVLIAAKPAVAMMLYEVALRAGAATALTNLLGRPGCAALPLTQASGTASVSLGCRGNRLFTGLSDDEMYLCIPGSKWNDVVAQAKTLLAANDAMAAHYREHQSQFPILT